MMKTDMKKALLLAVLSAAVATALAQPPGPLRRMGPRSSMMRRPNAAQQQSAAEAKPVAEQLKDIPKGTNGVPILNFENAPIELVLMQYATLSEKVLLPAPNLPKTQITLTSNGLELDKESYLQAIEAMLTMHGVVIEPFDKHFLRAFERKSVRTQGIRTLMNVSTNGLPEKGRVISQLIRLNHMPADEAQKAVEGFKNPDGLFQVFERNNAILVTDTQENVNRMLEILKELDVPNPVLEETFEREIKYAEATKIKELLMEIVTESQKDNQKEGAVPKSSGAPGFARPPAAPQPNLLRNLNRPGLNKPAEPAPPTPNAVLTASVSDADRGMIRGKVQIVADERSNKLIIITAKTNMDFFDKVINSLDVETTPDMQVNVIRLKYADAEDVEKMLNDLIGASSSSSSQSKNNQNQNASRGSTTTRNLTQGTRSPATPASRPASSIPNASSLGELNKDNVKVLADKRINGIVVMARKAHMRTIREVIDYMDVKLSQVLLETVIIQIELGDDLSTGIDWVQRGRQREMASVGTGMFTQQLDPDNPYTKTATATSSDQPVSGAIAGADGYWWTPNYKWVETKEWSKVVRRDRDFYNNGNYMLGGGGGSASSKLASLFGAVTSNTTDYASIGVNPIGGGVNYLLKSDKLNIAAVIQAAKSDSKSKVLASPILMTVDNKEATIEATDMIYLFSGYQYSGSSMYGSQVRNYEKRDIGLTVKVTPKINPNGTVMLKIEETFETQGADQNVPNETGGTDPYATVTTRKMSSDISVENRQTIVMGGLTKSSNVDSEAGIPILKDIPWIGKWLFGSVTHKEGRSELLVFITPYVLDDAEASQAEALRRKKALSDPRPWEDFGWSASPLADPVARREQLRRFNEEWAKQDEERKTKLAIEKAKMDRARKLEQMSEDERKAWIDIHKEELEKEEREAFEKQVEEQSSLREFVDELKKKDMEKAEKAVKDADAAAVRDNEYNTFIKEQQEKGKPLPAGETLKKDAEALKKAEEAGGSRSSATAAETAAPHADAQERVPPALNDLLVPDAKSEEPEQPKKDK